MPLNIVELFGELLDEFLMVIENDEREEDKNASGIYGTTYGGLMDKVTGIIESG